MLARKETDPRRRTSISAIEFYDTHMDHKKIKVKVELSLSTPRRHAGTVQVLLSSFVPWHYLGVSSQSLAPSALSPGENPVLVGQDAGRLHSPSARLVSAKYESR